MSWERGIIIGIVAIVLYGIVGLPLMAGAQETYTSQQVEKPTGTEILFDLVLIRPLGMTGLALGTTFFVASLPMLLITRSVEDAAAALVDEPFKFTFVRGMGQY